MLVLILVYLGFGEKFVGFCVCLLHCNATTVSLFDEVLEVGREYVTRSVYPTLIR